MRFRRPAGMLPLPMPQRGGSIEALRPFLNLAEHETILCLVVAWLLATLRSRRPLSAAGDIRRAGLGEDRALEDAARRLIDPNAAPVRTLPREERDLFIAANNGHLLAFDNLSALPAWLSDALCRLASGGSFAVRQLYTDEDEVLFEAARPIILNGIEDVVTRPDLADRAHFSDLRANMGRATAAGERALARVSSAHGPASWGRCLMLRPWLARAACAFVSSELPRMADFALWATACETAFWPAGTFTRAYDANRKSAIEDVIETDPVAVCVRKLMADAQLGRNGLGPSARR